MDLSNFENHQECHECGETFIVDDSGVAHHIDEDGDTDHDADADHVPYADSELFADDSGEI